MKRMILIFSLLAGVTVVGSGCSTTERTVGGAVVGGVGGAVVGDAIAGTGGAIVGGATGAVAGAAVGRNL